MDPQQELAYYDEIRATFRQAHKPATLEEQLSTVEQYALAQWRACHYDAVLAEANGFTVHEYVHMCFIRWLHETGRIFS
jgi:hypothetical protein